MNLQTKVTAFSAILAATLIAVLVAIGLVSFRQYSIGAATEHIRTSADIVRVGLTEAMINGVIDKRESFLSRLTDVPGLLSARVLRGPLVEKQFGHGLSREQPADELERQVLATGKEAFQLIESREGVIFRGTIPYIAVDHGSPNCLQCHQVAAGDVLGAVTITMSIDHLKRQALYTVALMALAVGLFAIGVFVLLRRLTQPIVATANHVENAVQRAIAGDFKAQVSVCTRDEIGQIAKDMNRLLAYLDRGLTEIGQKVAQLTNHAPPSNDNGNLLEATIQMVETLSQAAHFKQAIEEDETKAEIYQRLAVAIEKYFAVHEYSLYEVLATRNQMVPMIVDGETQAACRWCDPQILVRNETCRARRTGHLVNGVTTPDICYAFQPPAEAGSRRHICFPVMQSGTVGSVLQLVVREENAARLLTLIPSVSVYLREAAPVLEAKKLMETLRESNLRDPMTGLHNRRFLEESVENLVAQCHRSKQHMAILMLDLDYFKMVNDTYGHDAGDAVLKALSKVLTQSVRASDFVIRYGGEEFLMLLLETTGDAAMMVAEKIRLAVEEMSVPVSGGMLKKTISIGIADFPGDSDTFWQTVKFADVALYTAKETGRNRVVRFTPELWQGQQGY